MEPMLPMPTQSEGQPQQLTEGGINSDIEQQAKLVPLQEKRSQAPPSSQSSVQDVQQHMTPQTLVPTNTSNVTQQPTVTPAPLVADDVDVIEKEWVDKAKKIVSSTKENPHHQERQVSQLQADYLLKRYNKKIKLAE